MSEPSQEFAQEPRKRRILGPVIAVVAVLLFTGGFWLWRSQLGESAQAGGPNPVESTLHLETFVLNLADENQRSYLRVGVDLGLQQEVKRAEAAVSIAAIRDTILNVLSEAKVDDLLTTAGKSKLKQDILRALQERIPQLGAQEVYFTEFLIQR